MTHAGLDRRITNLEGRVTDIEESHGRSIYTLTRDVRGLTLCTHRLLSHTNAVGHGIAMIMERMGIPPIEIPEVTFPTEEEIDASFEEDF